jgi:hypothetical protein
MRSEDPDRVHGLETTPHRLSGPDARSSDLEQPAEVLVVRKRDEPNSRREHVVGVFIALGAAPEDDELVEMLSNVIREQQERAIAGDART